MMLRCRLLNAAIALMCGTLVLGSSCLSDIRNSAVSGGLDFVEASIQDLLGALIPVSSFVTGAT